MKKKRTINLIKIFRTTVLFSLLFWAGSFIVATGQTASAIPVNLKDFFDYSLDEEGCLDLTIPSVVKNEYLHYNIPIFISGEPKEFCCNELETGESKLVTCLDPQSQQAFIHGEPGCFIPFEYLNVGAKVKVQKDAQVFVNGKQQRQEEEYWWKVMPEYLMESGKLCEKCDTWFNASGFVPENDDPSQIEFIAFIDKQTQETRFVKRDSVLDLMPAASVILEMGIKDLEKKVTTAESESVFCALDVAITMLDENYVDSMRRDPLFKIIARPLIEVTAEIIENRNIKNFLGALSDEVKALKRKVTDLEVTLRKLREGRSQELQFVKLRMHEKIEKLKDLHQTEIAAILQAFAPAENSPESTDAQEAKQVQVPRELVNAWCQKIVLNSSSQFANDLVNPDFSLRKNDPNTPNNLNYDLLVSVIENCISSRCEPEAFFKEYLEFVKKRKMEVS